MTDVAVAYLKKVRAQTASTSVPLGSVASSPIPAATKSVGKTHLIR